MKRQLQCFVLFLHLLLVPFRLLHAAASAEDLALALGVPADTLSSASFSVLASPDAVGVVSDWGRFIPLQGSNLAVLSTGVAATPGSPLYVPPQPGSVLGNTLPNPNAGAFTGCRDGGFFFEGADIFDYTELVLVLVAPTNAFDLGFNFNFLTAEYPERRCSPANDRFRVIHYSSYYPDGLDIIGYPPHVASIYLPLTQTNDLAGTGMDELTNNVPIGAASGWVYTRGLVRSGETNVLRFILYDADDPYGDTQILLNNFRWGYPFSASATNFTIGENSLLQGAVAFFTDLAPPIPNSNYIARINWRDGHVTTGAVVSTGPFTYAVLGTNNYPLPDRLSYDVTLYKDGGQAAYLVGTVQVLPQLDMRLDGSNHVLSWHNTWTIFKLYQADTLAGTNTLWSLVTNTPVNNGTMRSLTLDTQPSRRFYRLQGIINPAGGP